MYVMYAKYAEESGHNSLQHNATHRNTLQHTATHRNSLQPTATHRNTQALHSLELICYPCSEGKCTHTQRHTHICIYVYMCICIYTHQKKLRTVLSTSVTPSSLGAFTPNSSGACITSGACGVPTYLYMCYTYVTRITRKLLIFNTLIGACTSRGACGLPTYLYMCYTYITRYDTRTLHICNTSYICVTHIQVSRVTYVYYTYVTHM